MGLLSRLLPRLRRARADAPPRLAGGDIAKGMPALSPPRDRAWFTIFESFGGAFQADVQVDRDTVLAYFAVYACITLISADIGKLRLMLVQRDEDGIWSEVMGTSPFQPVLRKPNRYQTRQKFVEQYVVSKLIHGNVYVLKERDSRGIVRAMYVLDPTRVQPLIAPDGAVYYQLQDDSLAGVKTGMPAVPASEIIHDTMVCLHHPLIGVSPLYACGLAAMHGLNIQKNATKFFGNNSQPGGILTAPAQIDDKNAARIKAYWENNYTGQNVGKVAVLGDGLKYEQLAVNAVDAQLIEQLKLSAEQVCSAFHVPPYKIGVGATPTYQNAEILNLHYYTDCLQALIESAEAHLDEGLGLDRVAEKTLGTEFDIEGLMRMDTNSRVKSAADAIGSAAMSPNEARRRWLNLKPVKGGETPYLQQQNYSLEALARRDAGDPFPAPAAPAAPAASQDDEGDEVEGDEDEGDEVEGDEEEGGDMAEDGAKVFFEMLTRGVDEIFADEDAV